MPKRSAAYAERESREAPKFDYHISYENEDEVLGTLAHGEAVNILVSKRSDIILSMDSHVGMKKRQGLDDDQVLLESLVELRYGRIYIDSNFHGASEFAQKAIPDIENKLNEEVLPELQRAA